MKTSVSNIAWQKNQADDALHILRDAGVFVIDAAPSLLLDDPATADCRDVERVRQEYVTTGFTFAGLQSLLYGGPQGSILGDEQIRQQILSYLDQVFMIGDGLGARMAVFGSPSTRVHDLDAGDAERIAADFFRQASDLAAKHRCTICFEANPAEYGCGFMTDTLSAVDFVSSVAHPNFKLNLDTSTMLMNEEPLRDTVRAAASVIGHIHISAPYLGPLDAIPHDKIASALHELDYDGCVAMEMKSATQGGLRQLRTSVEVFCRYYS